MKQVIVAFALGAACGGLRLAHASQCPEPAAPWMSMRLQGATLDGAQLSFNQIPWPGTIDIRLPEADAEVIQIGADGFGIEENVLLVEDVGP